jgi:hypothetical protein
MNTNALARLYGALDPWERVPLILAASSRGDVQERERLANAAGRQPLLVPDYHGLAEGAWQLARVYVMLQLDRASLYWRIDGLLNSTLLAKLDAGERQARERDLEQELGVVAHGIVVYATAWQQLHEEWRADPEVLLRHLPGLDTLRQVEKEARAVAATAEEVTAWLRERGCAGADLETVESAVRGMKGYMQSYLHFWQRPPGGAVTWEG